MYFVGHNFKATSMPRNKNQNKRTALQNACEKRLRNDDGTFALFVDDFDESEPRISGASSSGALQLFDGSIDGSTAVLFGDVLIGGEEICVEENFVLSGNEDDGRDDPEVWQELPSTGDDADIILDDEIMTEGIEEHGLDNIRKAQALYKRKGHACNVRGEGNSRRSYYRKKRKLESLFESSSGTNSIDTYFK
jgi:hypothetical protein